MLSQSPDRRNVGLSAWRRKALRATATLGGLAVAAGGLAALAPAAIGAATVSTLWSTSAVPQVASVTDAQPVELGVKFRSSAPGTVMSVRFYKGTGNTGTHTGSLWSSSGARLAAVTFSGETNSGWQSASFASPVPIAAGVTYVVSYHTDAGHYAANSGYFTTARARGSLTAPSGSNGVYRYGIASGFPTSSYSSTNYWVDAVVGPTTTAPTPGPTATATPTASPTATASPTPTATPTSSPTPTPTGSPTTPPPNPDCRTSKVWAALESCGWAGPANTGYPAGASFSRTVAGGYTVTTDGTVVDGWRITGGLRIQAKNVVVRNSWISNSAGGAGGSGVVNVTPGASATVDHNRLDGQNATHACVWHEGSSLVATGNDCSGVNDGMFSWATQEGVAGSGDNFRIEDNYFHGFTTQAANGHIDGYQTEGARNGVLRHNTFDIPQEQDAGIAIWDGRASSDNILVDHNLIAGSGFAVYAEDYSPSESSPAGGYSVTNIWVTDNVFSTRYFGCVGFWGVWYPRGAPTDGWHRTGNIVLETGASVDAGNPTSAGSPCN